MGMSKIMSENGRNAGIFSTSLKYSLFTVAGFGALFLFEITPVAPAQAAGQMAMPVLSIQEGQYKNYKVMVAGNRNDVVADHQEIGRGAQNFIDAMAQKGLGFLSDDSMDSGQKKKNLPNSLMTALI